MKSTKWDKLSFQDRFWIKVSIREENECWPWLAGTNSRGDYGRFNVFGILIEYSHRIAFELSTGEELKNGLEALHTCDYGLCCNPKHLFKGTQADNMADKVKKGRQKRAA